MKFAHLPRLLICLNFGTVHVLSCARGKMSLHTYEAKVVSEIIQFKFLLVSISLPENTSG